MMMRALSVTLALPVLPAAALAAIVRGVVGFCLSRCRRRGCVQVPGPVPGGDLRPGRGRGGAGEAGQDHEVVRAAGRAYHPGGRGVCALVFSRLAAVGRWWRRRREA